MTNDYEQDIRRLAEWLRDPGNAEPCASFPVDSDRGSGAGIYAWHGDDAAGELVRKALVSGPFGPLYLGRTSAPLNKRIVRTHLRNTKASTLRRSLAALLWNELELRCPEPNTIDAASNTRLTEWMLEHLSVTIVPIVDSSNTALIEADLLRCLDPPLNLVKVTNTIGRSQLRRLRRDRLGVTGALLEEVEQLRKLRAAEVSNPGVVVPITRATGKGSRRSRATRQSFWTPADAEGGA